MIKDTYHLWSYSGSSSVGKHRQVLQVGFAYIYPEILEKKYVNHATNENNIVDSRNVSKRKSMSVYDTQFICHRPFPSYIRRTILYVSWNLHRGNEIWSPLPSETDSHPFRYYTKYQFTDSLTCDIYSLPAITKNVTEKNYMIEIEWDAKVL